MCSLRIEVKGQHIVLPVEDRQTCRASCLALRGRCKSYAPSVIESIVRAVEGEATQRLVDLDNTDPWAAIMTPDDVRQLANEGADVGSHTMDHVLLDQAKDEIAEDQLTRSKSMIEAWTRRQCAHLCLPSGRFNDSTAALARRAGYRAVLTTMEGWNEQGADLYTLRRLAIKPHLSENQLLARMCGVRQMFLGGKREASREDDVVVTNKTRAR